MYTGVTIPFLNAFYRIQSNKGSSNQSQGVFETDHKKFSQNDLNLFQRTFGLTVQPAIDKYGFSNTDTCYSTKYPDLNNPDCYEGNLDLQYIMGISQNTKTYYWYQSYNNVDPYLNWITTMANEPNPPQSNSISWGTIEQVL